MKSLIVEGRKKSREGVRSWGIPEGKSLVIPDQSMRIRTILEKYTRGIPVDVKQYQGVYFDQTEFDLEKLNRLEFSEKMSVAEQLKAKHEAIEKAIEERRTQREQENAELKAEKVMAEKDKKEAEMPPEA